MEKLYFYYYDFKYKFSTIHKLENKLQHGVNLNYRKIKIKKKKFLYFIFFLSYQFFC